VSNLYLKKGITGQKKAVKGIQQRLIAWGFDLGRWGADGIWGKMTDDAVYAFQRGMGLKPDKIVGDKTFSALKNEPIKIEHFPKEGFMCHCQGRYCNGYYSKGTDIAILFLLERIRKEAGDKPITITSGYRCPTWNRKNGGALLSQHLYGRAADIIIEGMSRNDTDALCDRMNPYGGVGMGGEHITHVDVRGKRARWRYGKGDA